MPVVPFTNPRSQGPTAKPIDQTYLIMAAADLHEAGRLFEPEPKSQLENQNVDTRKS